MATHLGVWNKAIDKGHGAKLDFPQQLNSMNDPHQTLS